MEKPKRDSSTIVRVTRIRHKAKPHQFLGGVDPAMDRANRAWNTEQFRLIQDQEYEREFGFDRYWGAKMREQRQGKPTNNYPSPQQNTRSLEEIIQWWKLNNPYMTEGRVTAPLSDTAELEV